MIDLNEMSRSALKTAKRREEKEQLKSDTFSILKHCAGDVCEATQAHDDCYWNCCDFFPRTDEEKKEFKMQFADELADIITCVLIAAANEGVDIEAALLRVQEKNKRRGYGGSDK